jgi:hypothetical protein
LKKASCSPYCDLRHDGKPPRIDKYISSTLGHRIMTDNSAAALSDFFAHLTQKDVIFHSSSSIIIIFHYSHHHPWRSSTAGHHFKTL